MRFKSPERLTWAHLLVSIIVMGGSYGPGSTAHAAVALPSDVTAFGSYFFDVSTSGVLGDAEHSGSLYATVGGVTRQVELTYQADSDGGTLGPNNPVSSNLTHHGGGTIGAGDGFGGDAFVDAMASSLTSFTADTDLDFSSGPSFVSTPLLLSNQSLDQAYRVFISFTYDHFVEATGPDAGIRSDFDVGLDDTRLFNTELASDTVVGNAIDEQEFPDDLGGPLAASGVFQFDFVLSPGETQGVFLDFTQESPFFDDGVVDGDATYFLSIDNVVAIPEPTGLTIPALLCLLITSRRRRTDALASSS